MSDLSDIDGWVSRFEAWRELAPPLLATGKAKEALSKYPWVAF